MINDYFNKIKLIGFQLIIVVSLIILSSFIIVLHQDNNKCKVRTFEQFYQETIFPFTFKDFNSFRLKKYFNSKVRVDSVDNNNQGYITRTYTFSDNTSYVKFLVKPYEKTDTYYYFPDSYIKSDIIRFKNNIRIGMSQVDFFKAIKTNYCDCETFLIEEGDLAISYFVHFKEKKLISIAIVVPKD